MDFEILIPSRSRAGKLITPYNIPDEYRDRTRVYVAVEQKSEYQQKNPDLNIRSVSTLDDLLGQKLYLMAKDSSAQYVMLCDDDFTFFRRELRHEPSLIPITEHGWKDLFGTAEDYFTSHSNLYAVGVSMRQGNNRLDEEGNWNTRLNGCIIYNRERFLSAEHDRVNPMNDFDVNLQLLRRGYDNFLMSEFCYNQPGTNSPGGSSDYRTLATQDAAARRLAELHPGFVTLRTKVNKTGDPSLRERTEVTIYWKKARQSGGVN